MAITRVTSSLNGSPLDNDSHLLAVSYDGSKVLFTSDDLALPNASGQVQSYTADSIGIALMIAPSGVTTNANSGQYLLNGDLLLSTQSAYLETDYNQTEDVYSLRSGVWAIASYGLEATLANEPITDFDVTGNFYVFASAASNLVDGDANEATDIFIKSLLNDDITRLSIGEGGLEYAIDFTAALVDQTASKVVAKTKGQLDSLGLANTDDLYLFDQMNGHRRLLTESLTGSASAGEHSITSIAMSDSGQHLYFVSDRADLSLNDTNGIADLFHYNFGDDSLVNVTQGWSGTGVGVSDISIDSSGATVAIVSDAQKEGNSTASTSQVYLYNENRAVMELASANLSQDAGDDASFKVEMSGDGSTLAFSSYASNLVNTNSIISGAQIYTVTVSDIIGFNTSSYIMADSTHGLTGTSIEFWTGSATSASKTAVVTDGSIVLDEDISFSSVKLTEANAYTVDPINLFDVLATVGHIVGTSQLSGAALEAANVNNDGDVNLFDVLAIVQHIVSDTDDIDSFDLVDSTGVRQTSLSATSHPIPQYSLVMNGDADLSGSVETAFISVDII